MHDSLPCRFIRLSTLVGVLLFWAQLTPAQFSPAHASIADPRDHRFQGTREDWTSPALDKSQLEAVPPLSAFTADNPKYTVELLQVQWRWGDPIDLYVMKPKGVKNPPVILYLYGYPTDTDIFKNDDYEELVTKDGFAAVGFVSALTGHRYHDRPLKEWFLSELQESLATSAHDVQMVLNYLATRGDLDITRVGMFAQGSGASIAILASSVDPRIQVLEALDPWGDWPRWMATSAFVPQDERAFYLRSEFLEKVTALDPVPLLPKIQAKQFRLDTERFDSVTPKDIQLKFKEAAPVGATTMNYENQNDFKAAFEGGNNLLWIQHALRSLPQQQEPKR
jgi:hypothetical protein